MHLKIERFITERLTERSLSKKELVDAMGFKNTQKGLRRLEVLMSEGRMTGHLEIQLKKALEIDSETLEHALEKTREQLHEPYIWVETERERPSQITIAVLSGATGEKRIKCPADIYQWTEWEQIEHVADLVRLHHAECEGEIMFFGRITAYVYRPTFHRRISLDVHGRVVDWEAKAPLEGTGYVRIGSKTLF